MQKIPQIGSALWKVVVVKDGCGCYFVFPYETYYLTIKPLSPGCSPWLAAVEWILLLCNLVRNAVYFKKEKVDLFKRQKEASRAGASLFGGKQMCVCLLKLPVCSEFKDIFA